MLGEVSLYVGSKVATSLEQHNIVLEPREGTPVEFLTSSMGTFLEHAKLEPGQYKDTIGAEAMVIGKHNEVEPIHDEKMEWAVNLVTQGVTKDLEIAKNIIKPVITQVAEDVEKDLSEKFSSAAHCFEIVKKDIPKIFLNQSIMNLFERYKTIPIANMQTLRVFPELAPAELRRRINTGDEDINELIAEIADAQDMEELLYAYNFYFTHKANSMIELKSASADKHNAVHLILMYFLTIGLEADLPDGVDASHGVVMNYLKNLRGSLGAAIYRHIRAIERNIDDKELISSVLGYGAERQIHVNPSVYDQFLDEGGTPEAIFGAVFSNHSFNFATIIENKVKLERVWESQLANIHSKNNADRLTLILLAIRKSLSQIIDGMENIPTGSGGKGDMQKRLLEATRHFYLADMSDLPRTIKKIVFKTCFPEQKNACYIIDAMDNQEVNNPEDPEAYRRVAAETIRQLIAEWLVKNLIIGRINGANSTQ